MLRTFHRQLVWFMFTRLHQTSIMVLLAAVPTLATPNRARAETEPVVLSGVQYLKGRAAGMRVGESAMTALALLKADTPENDPALAGCLAKIRARFAGSGYSPERHDEREIYEAAAVALALCNLEDADRGGQIATIASYLMSRQNSNGSWDYKDRTQGDCSVSQYCVLALWECENVGARIPPQVWDRAAAFYLSVQHTQGSWNYRRYEGAQWPETVSMTAAGVGSLLICQRQLLRYRPENRGHSTLLESIAPEESFENYKPTTTQGQIDQAVRRGIAWIGSYFNPSNGPVMGQSIYYGLYGIERLGSLTDRQTLGRFDWFEKGGQFIRGSQRANGSWSHGQFGEEMNTVWAILFLTRSTGKSLRKLEARRLAAGTLLGGRGLPQDLTSMTVAGGKVVSRPMNGAVEGMLAVLEDPRARTAEAAVSGLVERYQTEGPQALLPHKSRFLKLLGDRDPGLRQTAAWALGRMAEMELVPALAAALTDADETVVDEARMSLQLLSRKIDGLGPPSPSTPDQRKEAARLWIAWYEAVRPLESRPDGANVATRTGPADGGAGVAGRKPQAAGDSPARRPSP